MRRILLVLSLLILAAIGLARAEGIGGGTGGADGIGNGVGSPNGIASSKINLTPLTGAILMTDNVSFILQTDNTSLICLAGATC